MFETFTMKISNNIGEWRQYFYFLQEMMAEVPEKYKRQRVTIVSGRWNEETNTIVANIKEWDVKELHLWENQWPTLVRHLYPVYFPNMIELKIQGNQIESVEGLINISMPNLQKLYINKNNIISIRVLRKAGWDLSGLAAVDNHIADACKLSEGCFPRLRCLWMFRASENKNKLLYTEPSFASKLQAECLIRVGIQYNMFCIRRCIKPTLRKKWRGLNIQ